MTKRSRSKSRAKGGEGNALVIEDRKTGELGICFLEGPAEYLNEMFAKGPSKTPYGELMTKLSNPNLDKGLLGGGPTEEELDKTTPINEKQMRAIFPYAVPAKMTDPLTQVDKTRIHDNIRRDGATKRALLFICYFMMPDEPVLTLALNRKYANKQRETEQLTILQNDAEYLDMLEQVMNRDDDLDLYTRAVELEFSAHAYGRSVLVKQYDTSNYPIRLIPLSSPRLGRVWVDKRNWNFLGVEYKDYVVDKRILLAKDIIHHEVDDYGTTPNGRYYGMAPTETTIAIGERNRAANEIAIPEIMKRMFAPLMLVQSKNKSQAKLQEIRDTWKSGKTIFYNSDMTITVVPIPHDLEKLVSTVDEGMKIIFRDLTVPLGVGWQGDQNRATFEGSVLQWYESVLTFKRNQLNNVLWRQHWKPCLELLWDNMTATKLSVQGGVYNYLMNKALNPQQGTLPFKLKWEFKNVKTTGFLDTAAALAQFGDRNYLTPEMIRTEAGFGKYNDEMAEIKTSLPTFGAMDNMMNSQTPTPEVNPGAPNTNTNLATQSTSTFSKGLPTANTSRDYSQ